MDVSKIRADFPTLRNGKGVYLDSACQTLRPDSVIRAISGYYEEMPACGGRSVHSMATKVSMAVDESRETVARFFGCDDPDCFIFTRNCTEGINTVARGLKFSKDDVIVTTDSEHNSNHVPWHYVSRETGAKRRFCVTTSEGRFDMEAFKSVMDKDVRMVSVIHGGNITGCTFPVKEIAEVAHDAGALVLADGAQAAPHIPVDLRDLDVDFYTLSMHKMLGPSGMGVLYGKKDALKNLRPLSLGGGTVGLATYHTVNLGPAPERFEAGLSDYAGIIGTGAALDYLSVIGMKEVARHDRNLQRRIFERTEGIPGLSLVGPDDPDSRGGVFSFNIKGLSSHDVAMMLDNVGGVMIRSGMHCAHPYFVSRKIDGCARASTYIYNDRSDVDRFADTLRKVSETFSSA
ncbi:MAG: cysteine desulfurase [Candidatus Methanomethylophilaceae archaeon]|jgi:cysteine desulfurase/selenocysteine lyase|nr:cysteine desulfurase [Candidatus Methanomethylophilaceae archaeon]